MANTLQCLGGWPVLLLALSIHVLSGHPSRAGDCSIPAESFLFEPMLPRTVAALTAGKRVTVVAIGSASTEGRAAGGAEYAWPQQFSLSLSKRFPSAKISIVNLGKARQSASDMAARFEKDIVPLAPVLVIWQTGTVDAVQNVDPADFRATLQSGFDRLKTASEIVVMDAQYSRRTNTMIDFEPYETTIREVADVNEIPVFPRRDLMRYWLETGEFALNDLSQEKRRAVARRLYACIGQALTVFVARRPPGKKETGP